MPLTLLETIPKPLCFWDFQPGEGDDLTSRGRHAYRFEEVRGPIARAREGVFGPSSLDFRAGAVAPHPA